MKYCNDCVHFHKGGGVNDKAFCKFTSGRLSWDKMKMRTCEEERLTTTNKLKNMTSEFTPCGPPAHNFEKKGEDK